MRRLSAATCLVLIGLLPIAAQARDKCAPPDVMKVLRDFFPAYNDGSLSTLDGLFSRGDRFRSYDVHPMERIGEDASKRKTLIPYFRDRHEMDDQMELAPNTLKVGKYDNGNRGFGFSLELDRTSDEPSPFGSGHFIVKGSVACDGIYFWNMTWESP